MKKITIMNALVRFMHNVPGERIKTKLVVIVGPSVAKHLEQEIRRENFAMPLWKGWQEDRPFYTPLKHLPDGNAQLTVKSTKIIACPAPNNAAGCRANVTIRLEGYANACNQGVRCRLKKITICEKEVTQ